MLKPRVISGDSFRGKVCHGGKDIHAENSEPDVSFPQYMVMIFTSSFDKQEVHCLLITIIYAQHRPYANPSTLASHCLSHLLLLLLLLLIPWSVIICIFSPLCYTLPCTKLSFFFPTSFFFVYIFTSSDGLVSFSFFESVLAKKHCCIFYPFLHFQRLFSVTFSHLSFCLL